MFFTKLNSITLFAASFHVSAMPTGRSSGKRAESGQVVVPESVRDLIDESTFNKALAACGIDQPDLYAGLTTGFTAPLSGLGELALLVGNTAHESGAYKFTEETACKGVTSETNECPYGLYHGRGFIQLSWKDNYEAAAKALGNPQILSNPDIVMNDMSVNWAT
ncbi:Chitinase 1, partial [Podochytrium sp. JEL0797]